MGIITYTRAAKCSDCKFIKQVYFGRAKRHICTNGKSSRFDKNPMLSKVALKDLVCDKWVMMGL